MTASAVIRERARSLRAGLPLRHGALVVVPLHEEPAPTGPGGYLTLDEACARGVVAITESTPGGSVPQLVVGVTGELPVLLVEGEILLGGKQNRILNASVLARAQGTTEIPVSCVERGRWAYSSPGMTPSRAMGSSSLRRVKSTKVTETLSSSSVVSIASYASSQQDVWSEVDKKLTETGSRSATSSLAAAYLTSADALAEAVRAFEPLLAASALPAPVGAVALVAGKVVHADVFDRPATFRAIGRKLVEGYCLDAIGLPTPGAAPDGAQATASSLLDRVCQAEAQRFASPGLGADLRIEGDGLRGFALEHEGRLLHLALYPA